jgi:hypothetical protein
MNPNLDSPNLRLFKIDASRCDLQAGHTVAPTTIVGTDYETRQTVKAGCFGVVQAVYFQGAEHALVVAIQPKATP